MSKPRLTTAEIEGLSAVELPERNLFARAIGVGGLVGVAVAVDDVVTIEDNEICVQVAVASAGLGCAQ